MKKLLALFLMLGSMTVMATPVNVNTADAATIAEALHGIGIKKAQEIVAYREANGAFKTVADLENVKGIGAKTIAKNQADILLSGASAPVVAPAAKAPKAEKAAKAPVAPAAPVVAAPEAVKVPAVKAPVTAAPEVVKIPTVKAPAAKAPAAVIPKAAKDAAATANPLK